LWVEVGQGHIKVGSVLGLAFPLFEEDP
jgi:hypothetical protein